MFVKRLIVFVYILSVVQAWCFQPASDLLSTPASYKGLMIFRRSLDDRVIAVDKATKSIKWIWSRKGLSIGQEITVDGDKLYIWGSGKGYSNAVAVDCRSGKTVWNTRINVDYHTFEPATICGDIVLFDVDGTFSKVIALDKLSGKPKWNIDGSVLFIHKDIVGIADKTSRNLLLVDPKAGKILAQFPISKAELPRFRIELNDKGIAVIGYGGGYFEPIAGGMFAVDIVNKKELWRFSESTGAKFHPVFYKGKFYVVDYSDSTSNKTVVIKEHRLDDGKELTSHTVGELKRDELYGLEFYSGHLLFRFEEEELCLVSLDTMKVIWKKSFDDEINMTKFVGDSLFVSGGGIAETGFVKEYVVKTGKEIWKYGIKDIQDMSAGLTYLNTSKGQGFLNHNYELVIPIKTDEYCRVQPFSEGVAAVWHREERDGKVKLWTEFIDYRGNVSLKADSWTDSFSEGFVPVNNYPQPDGSQVCGFMDRGGKVYPIKTDVWWVDGYSEGLAPCRLMTDDDPRGRWGYVDITGKVAIPPNYSCAGPFRNGKAEVYLGGSMWDSGAWSNGEILTIDYQGKVLERRKDTADGGWLPPAVISPEKDLKFFQDKEGKYGFKNQANNIVIKPVYEDTRSFCEGLAVVTLNGNEFFLNEKGDKVLSIANGEKAGNFSEGLAAIVRTEKDPRLTTTRYIDRLGHQHFQIKGHGFEFREGKAMVKRVVGKQSTIITGFIDKTGQTTIPFTFLESHGFSEGLAAVRIAVDGGGISWGFIDHSGKFAIEAKYDAVFPFKNGLAKVSLKGNRWTLIDNRGKEQAHKNVPDPIDSENVQ